MTHIDYNKKYQDALLLLNDAQKEAVEQIDGPVLVVAGPGTGKTHILASRIGKILMDTDTQPHNILCLTYTDAGVVAMRERLIEMIGPTGHRVHIFTFHSFANKIIQDHIELFGVHNMQPISDLEQIQIVHKILASLPANHHLVKGKYNKYFRTPHLIDLFKKMKSENWSITSVHQSIDIYIDSLPFKKEYIYQRNTKINLKGSPNEKKINEETRKMNLLRDAVALFDEYQKELQTFNRYEFADMMLWVIQTFKEHPFLLQKYQEQYLYFLVDEYQDTNAAQSDLLQCLIDYWDNPNVFIVGDDDQSIYEFQGAKLENIIEFIERYRASTKLVVLTENYRSSQLILNSASASIQNNQLRLINRLEGLDKLLIAKNPKFAHSSAQPVLREYENEFDEDIHIVLEIEKLFHSDFPLNEVAVIFAKHKQVVNITHLLQKKGIPFQTKRPVNVLDEVIVKQLRTIMVFVNGEFQKSYTHDYLLYKMMHFSFFNILTRDIAKIALSLRKIEIEKRPKWRDIISDTNFLKENKIQNINQILAFSEIIESFIHDVINFPLPILLERIINKSGLLLSILKNKNRSSSLKILHSFIDFIYAESLRNPKVDLAQILETFDTIDQEFRLSIPLKKNFSNPNGVHLVTAHSSKGLEFEYVFLKGLTANHWDKSKSGHYSFRLPETITFTQEENMEESKRRLFFVGITRAKKYLFISFAKKNSKGKTQTQSLFVDEILHTVSLEKISLDENQILDETATLMLNDLEVTLSPSLEKLEIDAILANFQLNISALNSYLRCPISFFYNHILTIPSGQSIAAHYGNAIHQALNFFFRNMLHSKFKQFPSSDKLIALFEKEMMHKIAYFPKSDFQFYFETGQNILKQYYDENIDLFPKKVELEYHLENITYKGIPILGNLDRVDYVDDIKVSILDYKTGSMDKKHTYRPNDKEPLGGKYWRQLVFYKILFENATKTRHQVNSGVISYLNLDKTDQFLNSEIAITKEDVQFVGDLIVSTWKKIQNHDFFTGCGEDNCQWCQFVENDIVSDNFNDIETENLDD